MTNPCRVPQKRYAVALTAAAIAVSLIACTNGKREQASVLVLAIDAYRRAALEPQSQALVDLSRFDCDPATSCAAKLACERSSSATRRGVLVMHEVRQALRVAAGNAGAISSSARAGLDEKASEAQAALLEGKNALEACDHEVLALRRLYNLPPRAF